MARKQNSWLVHVKKTLRENRDKSFKQVLKLAKKTYKKSASASSKGARKSRRYNKTKRGGGTYPCNDESGDNDCDDKGNKELTVGGKRPQSGGNQHEAKLPLPGQTGGNPIMDMVNDAKKMKGGSGTGGGGTKTEFGANAGSV